MVQFRSWNKREEFLKKLAKLYNTTFVIFTPKANSLIFAFSGLFSTILVNFDTTPKTYIFAKVHFYG